MPAVAVFQNLVREQALMLHLGDQLLRALGGLMMDATTVTLASHDALYRTRDSAQRSLNKKLAMDLRVEGWSPRKCVVLDDGVFYFESCDTWNALHADEAIPDVGALQFSQNVVPKQYALH